MPIRQNTEPMRNDIPIRIFCVRTVVLLTTTTTARHQATTALLPTSVQISDPDHTWLVRGAGGCNAPRDCRFAPRLRLRLRRRHTCVRRVELRE